MGLVSQILRDVWGRLWASTMEQGVVRVDAPTATHPSFTRYGRAEGLDSERVYAIAEDTAGHLYAAHSRGVARLNPASGRLRLYAAAQGLAPTAYHSAFRDRHGRLWFGTSNGLFRLDPGPEPSAKPPRVFLRSLEIQGEPIRLPAVGIRSLSLPALRPRPEPDPYPVRIALPRRLRTDALPLSPRGSRSGLERMVQRHERSVRRAAGGPLSVRRGSDHVGPHPGPRARLTRTPHPSSLLAARRFLAAVGVFLASLLVWLHRLRVALAARGSNAFGLASPRTCTTTWGPASIGFRSSARSPAAGSALRGRTRSASSRRSARRPGRSSSRPETWSGRSIPGATILRAWLRESAPTPPRSSKTRESAGLWI